MTIAIHTPDNDSFDKAQDLLEEDMIKNMKANHEGNGSEEQTLMDKEVEELRYKIRDIYHDVRSLASEARMSSIRQESVNNGVQDNNKSNFYSALIESGIFIVIGAAQVMYIKNLLDSKRIIWEYWMCLYLKRDCYNKIVKNTQTFTHTA